MNKTTMLKWSRKEKGMTQKALAEAIGVSDKTISELELHSERWDSLTKPTLEKINIFFEGTKYWEPVELDTNKSDITDFIDIPKENTIETKPAVVEKHTIHYTDNRVTPNDVKALTLIEFAYEGLTESTTHEDFVANINMMKKILAKYY